MNDKIEEILFSIEEISKKVKALANELSQKYKDEDLLVICLLRGGFMFATDLVKEMDINIEMDFMTTSSYHDATESSGHVEIVQMPRAKLKDRNILIVDDIIDSGNTILEVKKHILIKEPKSVEIAVLLNKPERRVVDIEPDYFCFEVPDVFVVGYGLDYKNFYRNKPYIFTFRWEEKNEIRCTNFKK